MITFFDDEPRVVAIAAGYVAVVAWSYLGLGTGVVLVMTGAGATRTTLLTRGRGDPRRAAPGELLAVLVPGETCSAGWRCAHVRVLGVGHVGVNGGAVGEGGAGEGVTGRGLVGLGGGKHWMELAECYGAGAAEWRRGVSG